MRPDAPVDGAPQSAMFGELLKQARHKLGLNHQEIAEELGVSRGSVYAWERGHLPQRRRLPAIAAAFGISLSELLAAAEVTQEAARKTEHSLNVSSSSVPLPTNQFTLEITGIRLNFPLHQLPVYVRVTIGPIESEVAEIPSQSSQT